MGRSLNRNRWTDEELLSAIAGIDRDAFSTLYRRHLRLVLAFFMRETHDPEKAADLTGEVFAAVMLSAHRYRPERDTAIPWILAIARNTLGTSRRQGRVEDRARIRLGCEPLELYDLDLERVIAIVDAEASPVLGLVDALPVGERDAVRARVLEERSYSEIASELQCSELVIRQRVSRGLGRLRKQIKDR